jgi:DNA (cytosine-5)-methyltransferase 1
MWREMARIIREVRPRFVFVENSPMLTSRGLGTVLGDLAALGFDARWGVLGAADVGAPHQRDRIWIVARRRDFLSHAEHNRARRGQQQSEGIEKTDKEAANPQCSGSQGRNEQCSKSGTKLFAPIGSRGIEYESKAMWGIEPDVGRVAHGVAARVDRLKAIGNGQVPLCAAAAWTELMKGFENDQRPMA